MAVRALHLRGGYFRYPYLDHGHTQAKVDAMVRFLAAGRYKLAPVSLDTVDYKFNAAYVAQTSRRKRRPAVSKLQL